MDNLFTTPARLPLIAPSILSADFTRMGEECRHILDAAEGGADLLHVDVMDGHFVPNLTMGPAMVSGLRQALPDAFLDVHLMVTDPEQYIRPFAEAGANHLTFHIEPALDPSAGTGMAPISEGYDVREVADKVHRAGMTAGLAINPPTSVEAIMRELEPFDLILVMSVNPGFSGQSFLPEVLEKVRRLRPRLRPNQRLEMDGGIKPSNAGTAREAGCDVLVAASAVFGVEKGDRRRVIGELRGDAAPPVGG